MVEFYDVGKSKTIVELLDLVQCEDGKAATILQNFLSLLKQMNIPTERYTLFVSKPCLLLNLYLHSTFFRFVGFSADTCNTMFGKNHSVTSLLKKNLPQLLAVKCSCHSSHLCASYASKNLPLFLEKCLKWFYNHFSKSSGRRKVFAEFQKFVNVDPHAILKTSDTRWLASEAGVNQILEQFPALKLYFTDVVSELKR